MKPYEKVVLNAEELDDNSAVINFDVTDDYNLHTRTGGYVMVRQDDDDKCFYISVFDCNGDVLSEIVAPFKFKKV